MNAFLRAFWTFGLTLALALHSYGSAPRVVEQNLKDNPPSGQSFRQWTDRQRFWFIGAQQAPGANITVVQSSESVRIPFFLITVTDSPDVWVQKKPALIDQLKNRIFGSTANPTDSLQGYYNQLFAGKLRFFDPQDIIQLDLGGRLSDYFADKINPRRKLFQDIKEALSHTQIPLEVYNNKQLNGDDNDISKAKDELDLAVIFVLATPDQIWPQRWWYEWTGDSGISSRSLGDALPLRDPQTQKIVKLSNYCLMPLLGADAQTEVIGYNFLAHEMLHAFGLPDLYNRNQASDSAGIGGWCCMAYGMYGGVASVVAPWMPQWNLRPVWPSAWCRQFIGVDNRRIRLGQTSAEGDAQLVSPLNGEGKTFCRIDLPARASLLAGGPKFEHYLLIEFRGPGLQKPGTFDWDAALPGTGFLIWEISEDVGRLDPSNNTDNKFWPCLYRFLTGQNDVEDNPLVGLWWPGAQARRSLDKNAILQKEQLWSRSDQILNYSGIALSQFQQNNKIGSFHYRIDVASPSSAPLVAATPNVPQPLVAQPRPTATVVEINGSPDVVTTKLPSKINVGLKNVFAAYPRFNHSIAIQDDEVKSFTLPATMKSKDAFSHDISSQLELINGEALGDSRAQIARATAHPKSERNRLTTGNLYHVDTAIAKSLEVKIGDQAVPVAGSRLDIQHEKGIPGNVRYIVSNPVSLPALPEDVSTSISKEEVTKFLRERFGEVIPKDTSPTLVLENGTGKLKWQANIPTVPTSGPVTIQVDAHDPNGLSDKTAIVIK